MKTSAVVFDFGGVITSSTKPERVIKLAEEKNIPWETFEKGYETHRLKYDGDFMTLRELYEAIWKDAGIAVDGETTELFMKEDSASWLSRRERTCEWMAELKARGFKIGILTNMSSTFGNEYFKKTYSDCIELADALVISGEERLYKPMKEIYGLMQERIGVPANEICFIDDVEKNVEGAKACGWNAIRFVSNEQVEKDFEELTK
jgi:epoxide hydrolase-like predicted phosphatase